MSKRNKQKTKPNKKKKLVREKEFRSFSLELLEVKSAKTIQENNSVGKDSTSNRACKNRKMFY